MTATAARRTPDWLLTAEVGLCPCGCIGKRRKGSFVAKTLAGGADLVRRTMFSDDLAGRPGLLQRLDPRVALASVLALLVAVGLVHNLPVLAAGYAGTLLLAAASGLSVWYFIRRVWLFVPIFTGIVVLPATLSVITHGDVVLTLWHWHGQPQGFTAQGLHAAGLIVTRVATSISLVLLLTLTISWPRLLAALRAVGVPRIFVLIIGMAYRYLYLLLGIVSDMFTARQARTVGGDGTAKEGRRFIAASVGTLFGKAHQLSEEVHQAMTARGFRGDAVSTTGFRLRAVDGIWAVATVLAAAGLLLADRAVGA
ncbi:MAG TPA: cobalt ECF transporter T component CbiQ [Mycobacteriales bacterium]|nr:cobalt ECF transporter T component CbiQ [Mycobacteriales bacterium]